MAKNTPIASLPWPELTDIPNAQTAFQNLANAIDPLVIPKYSSASARSSALSGVTVPTGSLSYVADVDQYQKFNGSSWVPLMNPQYLQTVTVGVATPSVTLSNIPATLTSVSVWWSSRTTDTGFMAQGIYMRVNGDAGVSRYRTMNTQSTINGTLSVNPTSSVNTNTSAAVDGQRAYLGLTATGGATIGAFGNGSVRFPAWNGPHSANLGWQYEAGMLNDDTHMWDTRGSGVYLGNAPFTSLTFLPAAGNWDVGSQFYLVGQP